MAQITLGALAVRFGLSLRGDPDRPVDSVAALAAAGPRQITFLSTTKFTPQLASTTAAAVILHPKMAEFAPCDVLLSENPHATFAKVAALLHPVAPVIAGVHPTAIIGVNVSLHPSVQVGPYAILGADCRLEAGVVVGPACVLGQGVQLAAGVRLLARVSVLDRVVIGARSLVHPGAVIGADGFGFAVESGHWLPVPQLGTVRIGADVERGANTTIDRGALEDTVIGEGVKIDNLVQIAHNCTIGAHTAIAACVGIAGSSHIGERCRLGGGVGLAGHLTICDDVTLTGFALVVSDIREPGVYSSGIPVEKISEWRKIVGRLKRIETLAQSVANLRKQNKETKDLS